MLSVCVCVYIHSIHTECFSYCLRDRIVLQEFCTQSAGAALAADVNFGGLMLILFCNVT